MNPLRSAHCPSCRQAMTVLKLQAQHGQLLELDLCFGCHGIWMDVYESQRMTPQSVLTLFQHLHAHKDDPTHPLKSRMRCPRCPSDLVTATDRTRSGSYTVHRCPNRHGRFGTFSAFMVEKGFVRHLNPAEVQQLAAQVKSIQCSSCGANVDLRGHDRCTHCGSAFALLDPNAVAEALDHFAQRAQRDAAGIGAAQLLSGQGGAAVPVPKSTAETYAQVAIETERLRERNRRESLKDRRDEAMGNLAVWDIGMRLIGELLRRW